MITHRLLDGGNLSVPRVRLVDFANEYATALLHDEVLFVVEQKPEGCFVMALDLDFRRPFLPDTTLLLALLNRLFLAVVRGFPTLDTPRLLVLLADDNEDLSGGGGGGDGSAAAAERMGIHIIAPRLYVNRQIARNLRQDLIRWLIQDGVGGSENADRWKNTIDESIYASNGLRMIGSHKCAVCPDCAGGCPRCSGTGRLDLQRVYWPRFVFERNEAGGVLTPYETAAAAADGGDAAAAAAAKLRRMRDMVLECSIIPPVPPGAMDGALPAPLFTQVFLGAAAASTNKRARVLTAAATHLAPTVRRAATVTAAAAVHDGPEGGDGGDADATRLSTLHVLPPSAPQVATIRTLFATQVAHRPPVTHVMSASPELYYIKTSSRYCANKGGVHNNVTVWFELSARWGIQQRCWCRCPEVRPASGKTCREYRGPGVPVPPVAIAKLFPAPLAPGSAAAADAAAAAAPALGAPPGSRKKPAAASTAQLIPRFTPMPTPTSGTTRPGATQSPAPPKG